MLYILTNFEKNSQKKKVTYTKYQQGDVVMYRLDDDEDFKKYVKTSENSNSYTIGTYKCQTNTKAIFAFGEVTGHTHRVEMSEMLENAGVTLHMGWSKKAGVDVPDAFEVTGSDVAVQHEEHDTILLPPGKYVVRIVREFNHITRRAQNVAD